MAIDDVTLEPVDVAAAVRQLGDRVALVKASVVGAGGREAERVPASNALPWTDVDQHQQVFQGIGVLEPPYDPETLAVLFENSSSLRPNVDAYATNIDGFGHRFEQVLDLDASDVEQRIANALFLARARERGGSPAPTQDTQALPDMPTSEQIAAKKTEVAAQMRLERYRLEMFFDACCLDLSFVTLRRRTRQDIEVIGNGYWEVLRDGTGAIAQFTYLPGFTMRLMPLGLELVEVDLKVKVSELDYDTVKVQRRFRRYVQLFEQQVVYFKDFGDPRVLSRKYGVFARTVEELLAADPSDGPATEVLHFKLHNPRSAYGTPRWLGALLAVLGSRQAEEVNYLYFENKSVPPLALLVSGGRLSAQSVPRIEQFIETHLKGKKNFHRVLVIEAESPNGPGLEQNGRMKIELRPLTNAQNSDATHLAYDERNNDKVGQSFRLPRLLRGDIRDFNKSTAEAALELAEMQVFQPEREEFDFTINHRLLSELGIRFWRFRSNAPVTRDPAAMADIVRGLVNANVLTPEEGRALAADVFNREFKHIAAAWVKQPVALTLAGLTPTPEPERAVPVPDVQKRCAVGVVPGASLADEAARLVALRDALLDAERAAAKRALVDEPHDERDPEVLKVPAAELASWFEKEAPTP